MRRKQRPLLLPTRSTSRRRRASLLSPPSPHSTPYCVICCGTLSPAPRSTPWLSPLCVCRSLWIMYAVFSSFYALVRLFLSSHSWCSSIETFLDLHAWIEWYYHQLHQYALLLLNQSLEITKDATMKCISERLNCYSLDYYFTCLSLLFTTFTKHASLTPSVEPIMVLNLPLVFLLLEPHSSWCIQVRLPTNEGVQEQLLHLCGMVNRSR